MGIERTRFRPGAFRGAPRAQPAREHAIGARTRVSDLPEEMAEQGGRAPEGRPGRFLAGAPSELVPGRACVAASPAGGRGSPRPIFLGLHCHVHPVVAHTWAV